MVSPTAQRELLRFSGHWSGTDLTQMPEESQANEETSAAVNVRVRVLRMSSLAEGTEETMGDTDTGDREGEGGGSDGDGIRGMGMGREAPLELWVLQGDRRGKVDELEIVVAKESNVDWLGPGERDPYGDCG